MCGTKIKALGWRQGSILSDGLVARLATSGDLPGSADGEPVLIVVSHDCDVTNSSLDAEPLVELLAALPVPAGAADGSLSHGKNPRRIQLEIADVVGHRLVEARAHHRRHIDRRLLLASSPDSDRRCERSTVAALTDWLARRYVRAALPDAFNARARSATGQLGKALKRHGENINAIYVSLEDWRELAASDEYRITLVATLRSTDYDDPKTRQIAQQAVDAMEERLQRCTGIEVVESLLVSESAVTLDDLHHMMRFDVFDYLSFREEDGELAPRA